MRARPGERPLERSAVLAKATVNAAEELGLSGAELAAIIGVSEATVSRMRSSARGLEPERKEGQLALLFLRVYRSLGVLLRDGERQRAWFTARNEHLGGVPAQLVRTPEGLVHVIRYLDAMRGKV